jgi:hypothetical protein
VLLIEEGYIGSTLDRQPPTGAEKVREYSLAVSLHVFSFPKDSSGVVHYLGANMPQGVRSSGNVDPDQERVFLKAKSASPWTSLHKSGGIVSGRLFQGPLRVY